jgi:hypothetical protein
MSRLSRKCGSLEVALPYEPPQTVHLMFVIFLVTQHYFQQLDVLSTVKFIHMCTVGTSHNAKQTTPAV